MYKHSYKHVYNHTYKYTEEIRKSLCSIFTVIVPAFFRLKLQIEQGEVTNKSGDKVIAPVTSYWEEEVPDQINTEVKGIL